MEGLADRKQSSLISDNWFKTSVVILAVCIGLIIRYPYFSAKDVFPVGDGGLFMEMIYSIKSNHYLLPSHVNYNSHQIPFVYPPLGFYLALLSSKVFGASVLQVVQLLPLVLNLLTIVCFVLLASELVKDRVELLLCSGIFSIVFQVYQWTAKGGGLSRSPGFLFTVLSLYFLLLYQRKGAKLYPAFAAVALGLVFMSHLEWALIAVASIFVFVLAKGNEGFKKKIFDLLTLGFGAALVSMPWWGTAVYRFGITPFVEAWNVAEMDTSQFVEKFLAGSMFSVNVLTVEDYFLPFFGMIGFVFALFYRRNLLLPVWLLGTYIVAPKNSPISGLAPLVILIAIGLRSLDDILFYLLSQVGKKPSLTGSLSKIPFSVIYLLAIIILAAQHLVGKPMLKAIKPVERSAMEYIEKNTSPDAEFVVLTPFDWHSADVAEWFPYLTKRRSLTTPQGLEWVSASEFNKIAGQVADLSQTVRNEQAGVETGQLVNHVESDFTDYDYVAIFANNLEEEFGGFLETGRYEVFYRRKGVLIFSVIPNQQ
ncbi:MAG: glycosyltransferase family 39 protein [Chloroflexi bacterium]|nr:glycosyltransferase family 39 protein [Chloroflexota bacterium]